MAFSKQFVKELDKLFRQRTFWLRSELKMTKPGQPTKFSRQKVDAGIKNLQEIASNAFAHKLAKTEFEKYVPGPKRWHIKGRGDDKKKRFNKWYRDKIRIKYCVYVFWGKDKKRCLWVGKTTDEKNTRPSSHFKTRWFPRAKRITIYPVKSKGQVPKLECLAIHRFRPTENKNRAATKKWTKACPLCKIHHSIEDELRSIFRLR